MPMERRSGNLRAMRAKTFHSRVDAHESHANDLPANSSTLDALAAATAWLVDQGGAVCPLSFEFDQHSDDEVLRRRWMKGGSTPESRVLDTVFPKPGDEFYVATVTVYYELMDELATGPRPTGDELEWKEVT